MASVEKSEGSLLLGAVFTIAAAFAVATMASIVKWSSVAVSTELLMILRWAIGLLIFFILLFLFRPRLGLKTDQPFAQAMSAFCWTVSIYCYYLSLQWIPMLDATLLLGLLLLGLLVEASGACRSVSESQRSGAARHSLQQC